MLFLANTYLDLPEDFLVAYRLMVTVSTAHQLQGRAVTFGADLDLFLNLETDTYVESSFFRSLFGKNAIIVIF